MTLLLAPTAAADTPAPGGRPQAAPRRSQAAPRRSQTASVRRSVPGAASEAATAFVADHLDAARALGRDLGDLVHEPDALAALAARGMRELADPAYRDAQSWVVPGSANVAGVRGPLQRAVWGAFRRRTRAVRPSTLLAVADKLLREGTTELRIFAIDLLVRILPTDPERAWQLLRRAAREAQEWVTVDTLAHAYAAGILAEAYRWAELEQLVYSPSRWERRLVASTIATLPFEDRVAGRRPETAARALGLVRELIGDAEADVQKALAWALRSMTLADPAAVLAFCRTEATMAAATADGHRAWVVRDALPKLPAADAADLRARLEGIRRRPGAPSTSRASGIAAAFVLPDPTSHPEPPLA